ncbi:MAG: galactose ABC transporter substrate-binding protein [Spirochaetales bacterium]|uniref:D-galactose/methyl-galactoside binding periplasmic protein MglB n=1 Tax=Candidatus Thalassospirochaeta sargassi TaxID=3119039 RepID=A0AAJ1IK81_9SPIO|nr:galactose ABC transporter substrate-binding protein [Spirochaetales bacterium]
MKRLMFVFLAVLLVAGAAFAGGQQDSGMEKVTIGALIRNTDEQFVADYADVLKKLAAEKGVDLKLQDSRGDMALQLDQLNTLLAQGVKYYVVVSNTTEATADIASKINAQGGGAAFSNIQPSVEALKVSPNFYLASSPESVAGQIQAQILDEYFKANPEKLANGDPDAIDAIFIYGQLGHPAQVYRTNAVQQGLKDAGYKLNIVAEDTANWKPDEAQAKMDAWLAAFSGEFDVVIANNDGMALGAVESLLTAGYVDDPNDPSKDVDGDGTVLKVPVLGVDATQVAVKSMDEGKLFATVLQDAVGQATTAFELAYMMATEGSATGKMAWGLSPLSSPIDEAPANDAAVVGQCYLVPFKAVTLDNYKDFMN